MRAIIQIESAWQPGVVSSKGAMGLMQLMPATAQHFGVTHPFYIHENVRGGVAYLAELQALFHGDFRLVVAAYAAGEKPILARGLDYSSEEVYTYVQRIVQQYRAELRRGGVLMAVGEWAILAGPVWTTPPTLDGGEWTSPAARTSHR